MMSARRDDERCGSVATGSALSASAASTNRARAALASGASTDSNPAPATTTEAAASLITYSSSAGGCDTASGTATPPARQMPRCTAA